MEWGIGIRRTASAAAGHHVITAHRVQLGRPLVRVSDFGLAAAMSHTAQNPTLKPGQAASESPAGVRSRPKQPPGGPRTE